MNDDKDDEYKEQREWHTNANGRVFQRHKPVACYSLSEQQRAALSGELLGAISQTADSEREVVQQVTIPPCDARALEVPRGCIMRLELTHGSQVADVNVWNAHNARERFYSAKTRQIHASHLSVGDSLWSCMPYVRPLATLVADSIAYGIDADNAGVHDVIGSRCDPYTHALMTGGGEPCAAHHRTCHSNLTRAVLPWALTEADVHDVFNVFMCTGFSRASGQYFVKRSPARKGDLIELFAHVHLLLAVSACAQGDVSTPCGSRERARCFPLRATVQRLPARALAAWTSPPPQCAPPRYHGAHALRASFTY